MKTEITPISPTTTALPSAQAEATIVMSGEYAARYRAGKVINANRSLLTGSQDIVATLAARTRKCDRLVISGSAELLTSYCEREFGENLAHPAVVEVLCDGKPNGDAQMVMPTIIFGSDPAKPGSMSKQRLCRILQRIHTFATRDVGHGLTLKDADGLRVHSD